MSEIWDFGRKYEIIRFNAGSKSTVMFGRLCRVYQRIVSLIWDQLMQTEKGSFMGQRVNLTYLEISTQLPGHRRKREKKVD